MVEFQEISQKIYSMAFAGFKLENTDKYEKRMIMSQPLQDKVIAVPESRQLDVLAAMIEKRGGNVVRCPLIAILDAPDAGRVEQWLDLFITSPLDIFIILTGEGIRRLTGFAERAGLKEPYVLALSDIYKITRGPKPGGALRELGLKVDCLASAPTTDGVIETLQEIVLEGKRIAVQLYGEDPNDKLINYLQSRSPALISTVAPYVYASDVDREKVSQLIQQIINDELDVIAFTSQPQVRRLISVAKEDGLESATIQGLNRLAVAAVGPVVKEVLEELGVIVSITPDESFFMKPMVRKMVEIIGVGPFDDFAE